MSAHAMLSPSSSSRWLACTPSAKLEYGVEDKAGRAAEEGTLAHLLAETMLKKWRAPKSEWEPFNKTIEEIKKHELFAPEMVGYVGQYVDAVLASIHSNSHLFVETKLDCSDYVPEGGGTGDVLIVTKRLLDFWDLKYGKGVEVSAVENSQLKLYALGALKELEIFDIEIDMIRLNIFQPRLNNHSEWTISKTELLEWAEFDLKPKAALAFAGEGEFVPGTHCRFCKVKARCRALNDYNIELAKIDFSDPVKPEFTAPALLSDEEVIDNFKKLSVFNIWSKAVKDYVYAQALGGKKWEGFKLVEGKSNRVLTKVEEIITELRDRAYGDEIFIPKSLYGLTALKGILDKSDFDEVVNPRLFKPKGKPTLVEAEDKRTEIDPKAEGFETDYSEEDD